MSLTTPAARAGILRIRISRAGDRALHNSPPRRTWGSTDQDLSVSSMHAPSVMLSTLGATQTDESKDSHPQD